MSTVVIGVGNPLMGDDGVGLEALRRLTSRWRLPEEVEVIDGGTWGMNLLHLIEGAEGVVLLDAIRAGDAPGTLVRLDRDELPRMFVHKISPHQIDLQEVLALAELRGGLPERMVALGIEPERVELGVELSATVRGSLGELDTAVVDLLSDWGHRLEPTTAHLEESSGEWTPARAFAGAGGDGPLEGAPAVRREDSCTS
jgi:hydrogenase maturation protease